MKTVEIKGTFRKDLGRTATKKIRKEKGVPCVMYGGKETIHFYADATEFKNLVYTPHVNIAKLNIEGKEYSAVLKDLQFHAVSDELLHIDFKEIFEDKPVEIGIPVVLEGFAKGVKAGGKLQLALRKIKVSGLPKDLPDTLNVNIEELDLGKSIRIGELSFPNLTLLESKNLVVASVALTRAAKGGEEGPQGK